MRILAYLPTQDRMTGAPRRLLNLALSLKHHGINFIIVAEKDSGLIKEAKKNRIDTYYAKTSKFLRKKNKKIAEKKYLPLLLFYIAISNIKFFLAVKKLNPDIIWIRGVKSYIFSALALLILRKPLILDVDYDISNNKILRFVHKMSLYSSNQVIFQGKSIPSLIYDTKDINRYSYKFKYIVPGINLEESYNGSSYLLKRGPIKKTKFKMAQIGSICDRKNQLFSLDIVRSLLNIGIDVQLFIIGDVYDRKYMKNLKEKIKEYDINKNVIFAGWKEDFYSWLRSFDLVLLPSKGEGVPNAVQESMFVGLPVIASNVGGIPDIIKNGVTGWILPLDLKLWHQKICYLIDNPDVSFYVAQNASKYALVNFSLSTWSINYCDVINKVYKSQK